MPKKLPEANMRDVKSLPTIPRNGYAEDYRDDWIDLVARRLTKKYPRLTRAQRYVMASVVFDRKYRGREDYKILGFDARNRPCFERKDYGNAMRRWATTQSGDPTDIVEPVGEYKEAA
jgi:hypothetical protein